MREDVQQRGSREEMADAAPGYQTCPKKSTVTGCLPQSQRLKQGFQYIRCNASSGTEHDGTEQR